MTAKHPQKLPPLAFMQEAAQSIKDCPANDPMYQDLIAGWARLLELREQDTWQNGHDSAVHHVATYRDNNVLIPPKQENKS